MNTIGDWPLREREGSRDPDDARFSVFMEEGTHQPVRAAGRRELECLVRQSHDMIARDSRLLTRLMGAHLEVLGLLLARLETVPERPDAMAPAAWNELQDLKREVHRIATLSTQMMETVGDVRRTLGPPSLRKAFRDTGGTRDSQSPGEQLVPPRDQVFMQRVRDVAEANLSNCLFGVTELADALGIGRRHLLRRFRAITGSLPSHFLRDLRLTRAAHLLGQRAGNVSEIAYRVGFAKPSYFANQFKKKFGRTPTGFREALDVSHVGAVDRR
ncbi:Helix-turn-helix domain-containing protein [Sulfidibacter corallicola]|uniref:Helix-turn-helix domain-containing protein n=1 Tax=Sulfidibacter corallicola TaxID=2818388 RepID=A0A8A4TFW6_SULCO|nr:AraC family transcriptional regulator [Sulfidibacter corallicola]QTD47651.1 helix-turn-helix domain-containing protein [Sulfidibacter corallicola]